MILLSQYKQKKKFAEVFSRPQKGDYAVVLHLSELDKEAYYFDTEDEADAFAEDWVLLNNE